MIKYKMLKKVNILLKTISNIDFPFPSFVSFVSFCSILLFGVWKIIGEENEKIRGVRC